jgi:4a-hydroxytetrahydrobiopterin dehydratase
MTLEDLLTDHCQNLPNGTPPLPAEEVDRLLALVGGWEQNEDGTSISKRFRFDGFTAAVSFLSSLVPIANEQDHHPDVHLIQYRWLMIEFSTHSIGGLSRNDFIMAAKVNELYGALV